ncbi:unnamed protein product [Victoria cruziana]
MDGLSPCVFYPFPNLFHRPTPCCSCFVHFSGGRRRIFGCPGEFHRGDPSPIVVGTFYAQGVLRNVMLEESVGHTYDVLSSL